MIIVAHRYFLFTLIHPRKTIEAPKIRPNKIPSLTLLINMPSTRPKMMANINAISPLLILGFLVSLIVIIQLRLNQYEFSIFYTGSQLKLLFSSFSLCLKCFLPIQSNQICQQTISSRHTGRQFPEKYKPGVTEISFSIFGYD